MNHFLLLPVRNQINVYSIQVARLEIFSCFAMKNVAVFGTSRIN